MAPAPPSSLVFDLWSLLLAPPDQLARDHDALDMASAFVDLQALDVAIVALDWIEVRVAAPAVDQHRVGGRLDRRLGGEQLGDRGFPGGGQALLLHPGGA